MKNLLSLMEEFSILGMQSPPTDDEQYNNPDDQMDGSYGDAGFGDAPLSPYEGEDEYEMDADGNPVLDSQGNPVKKASACKCDHATDPSMGAETGAMGSMAPHLGEDEFDFNV